MRSEEFAAVRKSGVAVGGRGIKLACRPGMISRLGIIVGSVVGNAVMRNRIKRVVREHYRRGRGGYPKGDCVVIARPEAAKLSNAELRDVLARAAKHLKEKLAV